MSTSTDGMKAPLPSLTTHNSSTIKKVIAFGKEVWPPHFYPKFVAKTSKWPNAATFSY